MCFRFCKGFLFQKEEILMLDLALWVCISQHSCNLMAMKLPMQNLYGFPENTLFSCSKVSLLTFSCCSRWEFLNTKLFYLGKFNVFSSLLVYHLHVGAGGKIVMFFPSLVAQSKKHRSTPLGPKGS